MAEDLTVVTVVENDKGLLDLMIRSVYKFTVPAPRILICEQGNSSVAEKYQGDPNITVVKNFPKLSGGSNRHGSALQKIIPMVETPKTAIIESDCILLNHGWDNINPPFKMVGALKGMAPSGMPLYHVCFMLFYTSALRGVDFRPGKDGKRSNRPYKIHEDVAWQVGTKINPNEVNKMDFVDCKTGKGAYFDNKFQSDEFWLNGKPLVAHFGRGSNIGGKAIRKGFRHPREQLDDWKNIAEEILA
jgi:hypothetical protein